MKFTDQIAMVTGANGGIGSAIVNELLKTDVKKIYACARNTDNLKGMFNDPRVQAVQLDITKSESIKDAVNNCADITVLINNSGLAKGTHAMCSAFAPVLAKNNGGYIVNILSLLSFVNMPSIGTYSASKAALHSFTQGLRGVLAKQNTKVIGVYPGPVATRATEGLEMPMADANDVAKEIVAGIIAEQEEIFPDKMAKDVMAGLAVNPKSVEREFGSY
jgi:short-subunit dehydrogenase